MSEGREAEKQRAALAAAARVQDGMRVGLGSGSTTAHVVRALGERVRAGLRIEVVAASSSTERLAREVGLVLIPLDGRVLDVTIDGADEVDPALAMIKGGGGALLRERVVAHAAREVVIAVDGSKCVDVLGRFPLPLEVVPFALDFVLRVLDEAGRRPRVRRGSDGADARTDQGNALVDCALGRIDAPRAIAAELAALPGVVAHGLFLDEADLVIVAEGSAIRELRRPA